MDIIENRSVCLFDLESTGLGFSQGIVEVAYAIFTIQDLIDGNLPEVKSHLVNPGCPIEPAAQKVHNISEEMIMFEKRIEDVWKAGLAEAFGSSYYAAGYNSEKYDVPLLNANLERAGVSKDEVINNPHLDVMKIYRRISGNRQGKLVEVCELYGVELIDAHRAGGDVTATIQLLSAMIKQHGLEEVLFDYKDSVPDDVLSCAKEYREIKLQIEDLEKQLKALKEPLLEAVEDGGSLETPYLTIKSTPGRKNVDYKKLIADIGLDANEIVPYTKTSKPSKTIRLV